MKLPLVSIVIPTYNEKKDVKDCVKSLASQSYKKIEIIFIDSSNDETYKIINELKKSKILPIKVFKQPLSGTARARNFGAKKSKGQILIFIDADMTFDRDYLKNLIKPILEDKTGKVLGTTHDYEIAVNTKNKWSGMWGKLRVSKESAKKVNIFRAIRKDSFLKLGGFDPKYGYADDQTFWFKYSIKPAVAENTTCYHRNPETLEGTYKQARWIGASWKERYLIFKIPLLNYLSVFAFLISLPFLVLYNAAKKTNSEISFKDRFVFYFFKFRGYLTGLYRGVFLNKFWH